MLQSNAIEPHDAEGAEIDVEVSDLQIIIIRTSPGCRPQFEVLDGPTLDAAAAREEKCLERMFLVR